MSPLARPALDPELNALLADVPLVPRITPQLLTQLRGMPSTPVESLLEGRAVDRREITVPAPDGAGIPMTVLAPAGAGPAAPCVYWMHGGGMIMGDRFSQLDIPLEWLDLLGAVVVTVDYRLAPEAGGATPSRTATGACCGSPTTPATSASTRAASSWRAPAPAAAWPRASHSWPATAARRRSPPRC
ncbi:alpha/beta hydrolase [Nonomuraea thailandensis]